jgi:thiol-disulfide isomerase/thioredoxin
MAQLIRWFSILPFLGCACAHETPEPEVPRLDTRFDGGASTTTLRSPTSNTDGGGIAAARARHERFLGQAAPSLDGLLSTAETELPNWAALRGRVVLLEFWSPWCGICHLVHDRMNEWASRWPNTSVQLLGVVALPKEDVQSAVSRLGLSYPVLSDPEDVAFRAYDIFAVPSLFLIDRNGAVDEVMTGYSSERLARIERRIATLVSAR